MDTIEKLFDKYIDRTAYTLQHEDQLGSVGKRATKKVTKGKLKRVSPKELELAYLTDPAIFNGVNIYVDLASPFTIEADDEATETAAREWAKKADLDLTIQQDMRFKLIFGRTWTEKVMNKQNNKILRTDLLDSKRMEFQRDGNDNIKFEKDQQTPKGYVYLIDQGDLPSDSDLKIEQFGTYQGVGVSRKDVVYSPFITMSDGIDGMGIVEPLYKTTVVKLQILEGFGHSAWRHGFRIFGIEVGDINHEPTPEQIRKALKVVKNINYKTEIAIPYYWKINEYNDTRSLGKTSDYIKALTWVQAMGLGLPVAILTGSGEETNRATLNIQNVVLEKRLNTLRRRVSLVYDTIIFPEIAKLEGWKSVPYIRWKEVNTDDKDSLSRRVLNYGNAGLLDSLVDADKQKVMNQLLVSEGLKKDEGNKNK